MSSGAQNMKTTPDTLGSAKNESGSAKQEQGADALGIVENESVRGKH
jgi:hypothetical protein